MHLFTFFFYEITEFFGIDTRKIAYLINRDPSRVRHWRKDTLPPKKIVENLIQSVYELLKENKDPYCGMLFISKVNRFFSNNSFLMMKSFNNYRRMIHWKHMSRFY